MIYDGLITNKNIPSNGVFVFGSNTISLNGNPKKGTGGSALFAHLEFGVEVNENMDNRLSKNGRAYGLTTVKAPKVYITEEETIENIKKLYLFAKSNPDKLFYIAYNGINPNSISLNGKTKKSLANLFYKAGLNCSNLMIPENIIFEKNFYKLVFKIDYKLTTKKGFDI